MRWGATITRAARCLAPATATAIGRDGCGVRRGRANTARRRLPTAPHRSARRFARSVRGRAGELEALAVEMYARGLSTRDIEALFADGEGKSLLSRTAVSEITERLWAEYEGFAGQEPAE